MDGYKEPRKVSEPAGPNLKAFGISTVAGMRVNAVAPELSGDGKIPWDESPDLCKGATGYAKGSRAAD